MRPSSEERASRGRVLSRSNSSMASGLLGSASGVIYADRLAHELQEGDIVLFKGKQAHDHGIRC